MGTDNFFFKVGRSEFVLSFMTFKGMYKKKGCIRGGFKKGVIRKERKATGREDKKKK
jgi:hypothetical protein